MGALALVCYNNLLPGLLRTWITAMTAAIFASVVYDPISRVLYAKIGLDVEPNFTDPHLSKTLGEFWTVRWNYMAAKSLRDSVYAPIMEGKL